MIKKRQHYVSRYYLKAWTNEKEQIVCLRDKNIFISNLMGIAQERFFYELQNLDEEDLDLIYQLAIRPSPKDMQQGYVEFLEMYTLPFKLEKQIKKINLDSSENIDVDIEKILNKAKKNTEEDYHAYIERIGHAYLDLIRKKEIGFFYNEETEDRISFLLFITLQYMRTNKIRTSIIDEFKDDSINMKKIFPFLAHVYAQNIALDLHILKYNLVIIINCTELNFITGDQPLINTYAVGIKRELNRDELEFYYPISPKIAILITKNIQDTREIIIKEESEINKYNNMIFQESKEQLYAVEQKDLEYYGKL